MILQDNIYGTFEEDAIRRDFSINAVYYSPTEEKLIDLVGGLDDIKARRIRLIGDPESRYREDPVRMLRAIRFKTKLDFEIDPASAAPMHQLGYLLQDIPPARLFEEILKLFMSGHGEASFDSLLSHELFGWLFPDSRRAMDESPHAEPLIRAALASTDRRIEQDLPVTPAFIYAALLWYPFVIEKRQLEAEGASHIEANHEAAANIIAKQQLFTTIPRRFSGPMRDIWMLQFRLPNRQGKKPGLVFAHKRFRAAYDFLLLREEAGEELDGLGKWWTTYQEENPAPERRSTHAEEPGEGGKTPSKRPRRRRRRNRRPVES
jgi:poly(A) polymerase